MSALKLRRFFILSILAILASGARALTGFQHPNAPAEAMRIYLPKITLPTVIVAAAIDGINPCAFTVLLLFITAMLATLQVGAQAKINEIRLRLVGMGALYIAAIFLTYLALGVGLLKSMDFFTRSRNKKSLRRRLGLLGDQARTTSRTAQESSYTPPQAGRKMRLVWTVFQK